MILHRMPKRAKWKLTNKAIEIIVDNGGIIFGGAVRDKYLHDRHAQKFYEHVKTLNYAEDSRTATNLYQDRRVRPDLYGRFVVPKDIDAYIDINEQQSLLFALRKEFPCITNLFNRDIKQYFPNLTIEENTIIHYRYALRSMNTSELNQWVSRLYGIVPEAIRAEHGSFIQELIRTTHKMRRAGRCPIYLDLMVNVKHTALEPPFGHVDFACNGLILDKHGYRLSTQIPVTEPLCKLHTLISILDEIEKRKARVYSIVWYRIKKMMRNKWAIEGLFSHVEQINNTSYDGHCLICHDSLHVSEADVDINMPHMKLKCCDARYHPRCLLKAMLTGDHCMITRGTCAMCSQHLPNIIKDSSTLADYLQHNIHLMLVD
jgi:hypothetical protein